VLLAVAIVAVAVLATRGTGDADQKPGARPASRPADRQSVPHSHSAAGSRRRFANVALTVPAGNAGGAFDSRHLLRLARGWRAEVWARVGGARFEAWTPQGDLLVSAPDAGQVWKLVPGAHPGDRPSAHLLVSGLSLPQGLAFDKLGGREVLYVAETGQVDRYDWNGGSVGARTVVAGGLPTGGAHPLKEVAIGRDHTIYVDIGSASNADPPAGTRPPRASVLAYSPHGGRMRVLATGVRNGDGLSVAPDGTLWTAVNQRDDIAYPFHRAYGGAASGYGREFQGYVNDHPPDEVARLTPGRNLGWPFCDPDPDLHPGRAGSPTSYANIRFDADAQINPGGSRLRCATLPRIQRGIPAHSAPLGFHFLQHSRLPKSWAGGAVLAVHGSWDRQPPRPPAVLWLPWESRQRTLGPAVTLVGGFQNRDGSRWGRPADAVAGPDGALYVSDDTAGAIYRIVP
jgi:glucose/arabinose dehydrogenase